MACAAAGAAAGEHKRMVKAMDRYMPSDDERAQLIVCGWHCDDDWWWPVGECGYGRTYREAMREEARRQRHLTAVPVGRLQPPRQETQDDPASR